MISADQIARAWDAALREAPDPFLADFPFLAAVWRQQATSYRERLDRPRANWYGEAVPRIEIVRANLRRLGKPRVPPRIPA